jgi:sorbitol/mannitol transport system permease protein
LSVQPALLRRTIGPKARRGVRTWPLLLPAVSLLGAWAIVPLALTIWYAFQNYNLQTPPATFSGLDNFYYLVTDPDLLTVVRNSLELVFIPMAATIIFGTLFALLYDGPFPGRSMARLLMITPFFVMPTVAALVWKNLIFNPVWGLSAWLLRSIGLTPIDWFSAYPMTAINIIVSWAWTPFAALIILTSLQSLDREQVEAARMDGAGAISVFRYVILPHLYRPISVVMMLEMIFFLSIYAEIYVTTVGGPGAETTNVPFYIYTRALLSFDVGLASAGGLFAILFANIVSFFFVRAVSRQL